MLLMMMLMPGAVWSEFFLDVYGGTANAAGGTFTGTYTEHTSSIFFPDTYESWSTQDDLEGSKGTTGGIRAGYWFEFGLGIAVDISNFGVQPDDSETDITLSPASFLLMYRYPLLINDGFPRGRLHPYIGAGLSYGSVEVKTHYSYLYDGYDLSDDSTCSGLDFRLGLKWFLSRHFAIFTEYRFSALNFDQKAGFQSSDSVFIPTVIRDHSISHNGEVQTHHLLGGVSYHF
jgi:opacity protein-like surface antigen